MAVSFERPGRLHLFRMRRKKNPHIPPHPAQSGRAPFPRPFSPYFFFIFSCETRCPAARLYLSQTSIKQNSTGLYALLMLIGTCIAQIDAGGSK
jgi:hypothetical protein